MKQVRIRLTCDACQAWHDQENDQAVETVPVSAGQTLELCQSHRTDLAPLLALIAEWGATPETKGRTRATTPVVATSAPEAPALNGNAPSKRGGKRARQRRANQAAPVAQPAELELRCPLCSAPAASADSLGAHLRTQHQTNGQTVYGDTCPLCNHAGTARGLGSHANMGHQVSSVAALFAIAQHQGDPHGVIASRAAALAAQ